MASERRNRMAGSVSSVDAVIAISSSTSAAIDLGGMNLVGIQFPAAMTGTTVTFTASLDATNYFTMKDTSGLTLSVTVSLSGHVAIVPSDFAGVKYIKLVSSATEAAARTIPLAIRVL